MLAEVLDDNLNLLRDVIGVQTHPTHDSLHGGAAFDLLGIDGRAFVRQLERETVRRVVLQHIEDELLLNRLPH